MISKSWPPEEVLDYPMSAHLLLHLPTSVAIMAFTAIGHMIYVVYQFVFCYSVVSNVRPLPCVVLQNTVLSEKCWTYACSACQCMPITTLFPSAYFMGYCQYSGQYEINMDVLSFNSFSLFNLAEKLIKFPFSPGTRAKIKEALGKHKKEANFEKHLLLSATTAMWSMPVVLTETENENDSANQNYVAKMMLQK